MIMTSLLPGIASTQYGGDEILMTIHDRQITIGEFERIYRKNNSSTALEQQGVEEVLHGNVLVLPAVGLAYRRLDRELGPLIRHLPTFLPRLTRARRCT